MRQKDVKKMDDQDGRSVFREIEDALADEFARFLSFADHDGKAVEPFFKKGKKPGGVRYEFTKKGTKYSFFYREKAKLSLRSLLTFSITDARTGTLSFSLEDVIAYRQLSDFRCCFYPYLHTAEEASRAFRTLASVYLKNAAAIEKIFENEEEFYRFLRWKQEEVARYFEIPSLAPTQGEPPHFEDSHVRFYESAELLRHLDRIYSNFLQGNYEAMLRRWDKLSPRAKGQRAAYEAQMVAFARKLHDRGERFDAYDGATPPDYKALEAARTGSDQIKYQLLLLLVWFVFFALLFVGAHLGLEWLVFGSALYSTAREGSEVLFQLAPALFAAILPGSLTGSRLQKKRESARAAAREGYAAILHPRSAGQKKRNRIAAWIFASLFFLLILLVVTMPIFAGMRFYDEYLTVSAPAMLGSFPEGGETSTVLGVFKTVTVRYDDLAAVVEKPDRINPLGQRIKFPSYLLRWKGGEEFDLYDYGDYDSYRAPLAALFSEKGIPLLAGAPEPVPQKSK